MSTIPPEAPKPIFVVYFPYTLPSHAHSTVDEVIQNMSNYMKHHLEDECHVICVPNEHDRFNFEYFHMDNIQEITLEELKKKLQESVKTFMESRKKQEPEY